MHKGIILLVKSENKKEAKSKMEEFLEEYQNQVWDWYSIGGRWMGTLMRYDPQTNPANIEICLSCKGIGKIDGHTCNICGGKGKKVKWPTKWNEYDGDITSLKNCITIVNEWKQDPIEVAKKEEKEAKKYKEKKQFSMVGYCLQIAAQHYQQNFHFDCNVYNIENYDYSIPTDIENYYAIMIDIHN